jgi:hypothetical protein
MSLYCQESETAPLLCVSGSGVASGGQGIAYTFLCMVSMIDGTASWEQDEAWFYLVGI